MPVCMFIFYGYFLYFILEKKKKVNILVRNIMLFFFPLFESSDVCVCEGVWVCVACAAVLCG